MLPSNLLIAGIACIVTDKRPTCKCVHTNMLEDIYSEDNKRFKKAVVHLARAHLLQVITNV